MQVDELTARAAALEADLGTTTEARNAASAGLRDAGKDVASLQQQLADEQVSSTCNLPACARCLSAH